MKARKGQLARVRPVVHWACLLIACASAGGEIHLEEPIAALVAEYRAATGADVGVHVVRLSDDRTVCRIRSEQLFIPASNQKLFTAAVALRRLGPDFRFRTKLALVGKDLVVIGDGDPTTGDDHLAASRGETIYAVFDRWGQALKESGIRCIQGDLTIQAGIFRPPYFHPDWPADQRQRWYAAPVAAVNFHDNCYDIGFEVTGERVEPLVSPQSRLIRVRSLVRRGKRHLWRCSFDDDGTSLRLTGTVTRSTPQPLPVAAPDPPALFACVLEERLLQAGIRLHGKLAIETGPADRSRARESPRIIAVQTTPLSAVLRRSNKQSLNMMAECLFLRSAVEDGEPATWEKAAEIASTVIEQHYGLDRGQFRIADGSGLSRNNRSSPAAITALLRALVGEGVFVQSLAIAGVDGSLRRRLPRADCRGRILGKTGSLIGASALSGYVLDARGKPRLAFSALINGRTSGKGHTARRFHRQLCEALLRAVDEADP